MFKKFLSFIYLAKIQNNNKYLLSPIIIIKKIHFNSFIYINIYIVYGDKIYKK